MHSKFLFLIILLFSLVSSAEFNEIKMKPNERHSSDIFHLSTLGFTSEKKDFVICKLEDIGCVNKVLTLNKHPNSYAIVIIEDLELISDHAFKQLLLALYKYGYEKINLISEKSTKATNESPPVDNNKSNTNNINDALKFKRSLN